MDQVKTIIIIICVHYIYIYSIKNYKYSSGHEKKKKKLFVCYSRLKWENKSQILNLLQNLSGKAIDLSKERSFEK